MAEAAEYELRDDRARGLLEAYDGDGTVTGRIQYFVLDRDGAPAALVAVHTVVDRGYEGRGIAGALVREFYAIAGRAGLAVVPLCPYAARWAGRHPDEAPEAPAGLVEAAEEELRARPDRW
ncbi:GNAT family N-acetyltransferase [Streptomyces sp. NPDC020875]|uniref:GNAT family N-acetyltransferase n=1 Tax=Streptomyces sp. NPDC020875 TaxID=3154898 RepID=UPI0034041746